MTALAPTRELVRIVTGAHLYGTTTPQSDLDLKAVMLPLARDILLSAAKATCSESTNAAPGVRNAPGDIDLETHTLQRFVALLCEAQPSAVEMLFAPDTMLLGEPDPLWRAMQALGPALLSRQADMFVRYCRRQAEVYGAKGARRAAAQRALTWLDDAVQRHGAQARLEEHAAAVAELAAATPHIAIADIAVRPGHTVRHLALCGRQVPFTAGLSLARDLARRVVEGYGQRAREAEQQDGVDWKALSHAVRVGREVIELLQTGRLHFPLHDAPRLLAIKLGQIPYDAVVDEIEQVLAAVEDARRTSPLPEQPDLAAAEAFILEAHRAHVIRGAA